MASVKEITYEILSLIGYVGDRLFGIHGNIETLGKGNIVIGIHGIFGGWTKQGLYKYLTEHSRQGLLLDFGWQTGKIDEYVGKLALEIKKRNIDKPTLIGYSMGSLIAVRYAQKYGWDRVEQVITIAAPFRGAKLAQLINWLPAGKDMLPDSDFLKELRKTNPPKSKLICIVGKWDQFVGQEDILPGCERVRVPLGGHTTLQRYSDNLKPVFDKYLRGTTPQ